MKPFFGLLGIIILVLLAESLFAQYLPPVIGNTFQSEPIPNFTYPEKKPELKAVQENQPSKLIYRQYEDELQVPAQRDQYQIILTPVADQQPKVLLPNSAEPQQVSGMTAQTIYYFPPPTFPDPIPLTVYRPTVPQQPRYPQSSENSQYPQNWSPYYSALYAPPMITQPHYFGPPKQDKGRRFSKKAPGVPGQPVVGPPTLVYPNGIVVRPKVYLPQQPFKNAVRAITP